MNNIKLVDGWETMPKWEVIRQVEEEGRRWAYKYGPSPEYSSWIEASDQSVESLAVRISDMFPVAIIDDIQPVIEWDEFDWGFFNQDGFQGLPIIDDNGRKTFTRRNEYNSDYKLRQTPFYYWPGGECPVPGNVEVEIINYVKEREVNRADFIEWRDADNEEDVCAFRLTGKVYPPKHKEVG